MQPGLCRYLYTDRKHIGANIMIPEFNSLEDLFILNEAYLKVYPDAEPLTSLLFSYGQEAIFELYAEANGRKIIIEYGEGEDNVNVSFQ